MKPSLKNIAVSVIAVALLIAGVSYFSTGSTAVEELSEKTYHKVERSDLNISIIETGVLQAVNNTSVKNHLSGNSRIIYIIEQGTIVKKGDKLVELDSSAMKLEQEKLNLEIENNKTSVGTAQNTLLVETSTVGSDTRNALKAINFAEMDLTKFKELGKKQQLRNAETDINNAEDSYKLTQQRYEWSKKLAEKGFETKSQVERDKLDLNLKTKALETAKSKQQILIKFDLPKEEAELESKLTEALKKHERVVTQGKSKITRAKAALASAQRRLKLNQERLAEMEQRLEMATLYAPENGLVLYPQRSRRSNQSHIEEGAQVNKNRELIILPDLSSMKVKLKVPEFHISKLQKEQFAYVTIDSVQSDRLKAKVFSVAAVPDKDTAWYSNSDNYYTVEVLITDPLPNVKPSVSAKVEIIIKDLKNVISIPIQSIKTEKGNHFCFIKDGEKEEKRALELGYINNTHAEVLSGLSEGEEVLLTAPF